MIKWFALVGIALSASAVATAAETLNFHAPATASAPQVAQAMRSLAERALPVYENPNRAAFLTNLSALQMVAGEFAAAYATRQSLHAYRKRESTARPVDLALIYDLYASARARAARSGSPLRQTFTQALRASFKHLSDRNAFTLTQWLSTPLSVYQANLQDELDRLQGRKRVSVDEAVNLSWLYLSYEAFRSFSPFVGKLIAADDARRYVEQHEEVPGPHRGRVSVTVIRPKHAAASIAALLEITKGAQAHDRARECAAHGYAGVVAHVMSSSPRSGRRDFRGRSGEGARAVIDWIARQSWSNGRVGLYGSGVSASAAWEAALHPPRALVALAATSVAAPAGNVRERRSERHSVRHGVHHRGDAEEVHLAVLTTTGYFDANQAASLAEFEAEQRRDPNARQRLLIGPYDSEAMRRGALPVLAGYTVDRHAIIDLRELRFEWFDHVLRGAKLPHVLAGRVNYEVMGADLWRHAKSIAAMSNWSIRLYPHDQFSRDHYTLTGHEPSHKVFVEVPVESTGGQSGSNSDPASATDAGPGLPAIVSRRLPSAGVGFVSGPLHRPLEVSGRISGVLEFAARLTGLWVDVDLYELSAKGEYFRFLTIPTVVCGDCADARARRRDRRFVRRRIAFESARLTSVELHTGSRIVLVLDASEHRPASSRRARETRHDLKRSPPIVKWYGGSVVELPVRRDGSL